MYLELYPITGFSKLEIMLRNLFYVLLATLVFFIAMALFPFIAVGYILLLGYAIIKG